MLPDRFSCVPLRFVFYSADLSLLFLGYVKNDAGGEVKRYFYEIFVTNVSPVFLESSIHTG